MDANTAGVLNSVLNIISIVVTALMLVYVAKSNKKMNAVEVKVDVVEKKLDENHKLNNGNLTKLLETTEKLATAQERARGDTQDKPKK